MKSALRHLAWTLPVLALLAGCNGGESAKPEPHAVATYAPATWKDLPAVSDEDLLAGFYAWRSGCEKLKRDPVWAATCEAAGSATASAAQVRTFLEQNLEVYGLRSAENNANGLITGYYEPVYPGSLKPTEANHVAVYGVPDDMIVVDLASVYPELKGKRLRGRLDGRVLKPYDTAEVINREGVKAPVLAWLTDPMDLQFLQIQGSGRVQLEDGRQLRLGYADQNGHPYRPIGRWLVAQGELPLEKASMDGIKAWAEANPERLHELLNANPSYVFFRELPASSGGPVGALGVPLSAGRSIAIDPRFVPLGAPVFLSTTHPLSATPLQRLVLAQDTGGAIKGVVRADFFWGFGADAGREAGRMRQQGSMWVLLPNGVNPPEPR